MSVYAALLHCVFVGVTDLDIASAQKPTEVELGQCMGHVTHLLTAC